MTSEKACVVMGVMRPRKACWDEEAACGVKLAGRKRARMASQRRLSIHYGNGVGQVEPHLGGSARLVR